MLGLNGGLIGKPRQTAGSSYAPGVWTANEQAILKKAGLWNTDTNWSNVKLLIQPTTDQAVIDISQSRRALTINGNTKVGQSFGGPALLFDELSDYIQVANSNDFDANQTFTLEVDFIRSASGSAVYFARGGSSATWSTTNGLYYMAFIESDVFYWMWNNNGTNTQIQATAPPVGSLNSFIVSSDGTTTSAWLNASRIGTSTVAYTQVTTRDRIYIGKHPSSTSYDTGGKHIRRLRWTSSVARYSGSSITLPNYPFIT